MDVFCDHCDEMLLAPGGILLGPPGDDGRVSKRHLCRTCYSELSSWMDTQVPE